MAMSAYLKNLKNVRTVLLSHKFILTRIFLFYLIQTWKQKSFSIDLVFDSYKHRHSTFLLKAFLKPFYHILCQFTFRKYKNTKSLSVRTWSNARKVLRRWKITKICIKTKHFIFSATIFFKRIRVIWESLWHVCGISHLSMLDKEK